MSADTQPAELSEPHRAFCDGSDHLPQVGHEAGEPYEPDDHGEPLTGGQQYQCMCGHPAYYTCPDWLGIDDTTTTTATAEESA